MKILFMWLKVVGFCCCSLMKKVRVCLFRFSSTSIVVFLYILFFVLGREILGSFIIIFCLGYRWRFRSIIYRMLGMILFEKYSRYVGVGSYFFGFISFFLKCIYLLRGYIGRFYFSYKVFYFRGIRLFRFLFFESVWDLDI